MKTGEIIRKLRKDSKMTQKDFAAKLEISPSYLSELENGKRNLNISTINKLAKKLDVSTTFLLNGASTVNDIEKEAEMTGFDFSELMEKYLEEQDIDPMEYQLRELVLNGFLEFMENPEYDLQKLVIFRSIFYFWENIDKSDANTDLKQSLTNALSMILSNMAFVSNQISSYKTKDDMYDDVLERNNLVFDKLRKGII